MFNAVVTAARIRAHGVEARWFSQARFLVPLTSLDYAHGGLMRVPCGLPATVWRIKPDAPVTLAYVSLFCFFLTVSDVEASA